MASSLKQQQQQQAYALAHGIAPAAPAEPAPAPAPPATLGDRMKAIEGVESMRRLRRDLPILVRLDGRHFHTFTRGLSRPFDEEFTACMLEAARAAMETSGAVLAYTQSDEISLVIPACDSPRQEHIFGGRIQKLCSTLAAVTSLAFLRAVQLRLPAKYADRLPTFDCRVWNAPCIEEAANCILWRELDAEKNSIAMHAQSLFSHAQLHGKTGVEMREMVRVLDDPWEDLQEEHRRGSYLKRVSRECAFTPDELEALPEKHEARTKKAGIFYRSEIIEVPMPRLADLDMKQKLEALF